MKRRDFIRSASIGSSLLLNGGLSFLTQSCQHSMDMDASRSYTAVVEGDFNTAFQLPLQSSAKNSNLSPQYITTQIFRNKNTQALGYTNMFLGPTLRANNGESVAIRLTNQLSEETNIHWHGLIIPPIMDGHPKNIIPPGGSFNYQFTISQRAGTYWYHPHPHGTTGSQVYRGLAGFFIVNDAEEIALNLPAGNYEIPFLIQDKRLAMDSSLRYSPTMSDTMTGYLGDTVMVNGLSAPYMNIESRWYRLRVLNGSNARLYNLAFSNNAGFYVIGSDGGLLQTPERVNSILLAPGERADLLIDFTNYTTGTELFLLSNVFSNGGVQGEQSFKICKFNVVNSVTDNFTLPSTLSTITRMLPDSSIRTRNFDIGNMMNGNHGSHATGGSSSPMHTINNKIYSMDRIDETVRAGETEVWEFDNSKGDEIHPMHIHGLQFQVLGRTGGRGIITPIEKGWKDTVLCMPGEKVKVILTFPYSQGTFVLHCHNLEHSDDGMMLNYTIQ
ncbi:MAG: multicopper oxidase domain-containing protein [Candidatus Kapabacteria bacterium]|nr:multicopper oxidase domain-containing protein [Candidatus Kapabacteria bacterium]